MAAPQSPSTERSPASRVPHVLHIAHAGVTTRFGRMFRDLGIALSVEGVRVSILTDDAETAAALDGTPTEDYVFAPLSGWGAGRLRSFLSARVDPPPDVVHLWGTVGLNHVSAWTHSVGVPLIVHLTGTHDLQCLLRRARRPDEHWLSMCSRFAEQLRVPGDPRPESGIDLVPPALLIPEQVPGVQMRQKMLGVLWTGKLDADSHVDLLVEAVARLRATGAEMQVALIGDGRAAQEVWRKIVRHRVADCFSLVDEPRLWNVAMGGADVCVVPACQAELSLAPILAMALGKVVITSRDQVADWFVEDETTFQFAPGSAVELAYHLERAAAGHPSVLALAQKSAEFAHREYSITKIATMLAERYRTLSGIPAADPETSRDDDGAD